MADGLREAIKKRVIYALAGAKPPLPSAELERVAWECTDAALRALRPVEAVAEAEPVILYFPTPEDRAGFIAVCHEALPNAVAVEVP